MNRITLPTLTALASLALPVLSGNAQDQPASTPAPAIPAGAPETSLQALLRDALYEEEATRDLTKAAAGYEALLAQWAGQRSMAAAALYRLAEVRRKQDRKADAIALHQRLVAEFPDIEPHARLSRENLAALGATAPASASPPAAATTDPLISEEEATALQRVKKLAAQSPDLLIGKEFTDACAKGWLTVLQFLVSKDVADNGDGFIAAAGNGHLAIVRELLPQKPLAEYMGKAVDNAANQNRIAVLKLLLESGASPAGSSEPHEPLTAAILNNSAPAVDLLLQYKADANPATASTSPLYAAAGKGNAATVERLLALGADANFGGLDPSLVLRSPQRVVLSPGGGRVISNNEGKGSTPLHAAIAASSEECVKLLLAAKANPNSQNEAGWTPLLLAVYYEIIPFVELLLAAGADPSLRDQNKMAPLALAAQKGSQAICAALLKAKADPNQLCGENDQAAPMAFLMGNEAQRETLIPLFLEHGADPFAGQISAASVAPPEWRTKFLRSHKYPALAATPAITLVFADELTFSILAERKTENETPRALPALLREWNTSWSEWKPSRQPKGLPGPNEPRPDWSTLRLWRKGGDGKMQETVIKLTPETVWPALQWGDVVELTGSNEPTDPFNSTKGIPPETIKILTEAK